MPAKPKRRGHIKTFFSYKGGVGRTMAVANVGFLAALSGKRVLLMDWDLEAPGLAVYFRGVTDHLAANEIRKAPGILDLFVEWQAELHAATGKQAVKQTLERFRSGKPFAQCARPLVPARHLPKGASLDHIGAGAPIIGTLPALPYAEALSLFNWPAFFTDYAGGAMLETLTSWARENYDLILIDSRTGLADVAGICTMQLPDEAVLCFVLNRQNTEGVADIAASIVATRGAEVGIRLAPMRVSKERPAEEADARARARREMINAGLDIDHIESDMVRLSVGAASNVPFYETLAPFAATSSSADPLTFDYLRLTQELVDRRIEIPVLDPVWIESVRRRLQPRMTTIEYLDGLETADPDRACEELARFLDGALDADPRELDRDYVETLVGMAMGSGEWMWSGEVPARTKGLAEKALVLLHQLHRVSDEDWRRDLVEAMDDFGRRWPAGGKRRPGIEFIERDEILADGAQTVAITLMRAWLRGNVAIELFLAGRIDAAEAQFESAFGLLNGVSGPLVSEDAANLAGAHAEILAQRARLRTKDDLDGPSFDLWIEVLGQSRRAAPFTNMLLEAEALFNLATHTGDREAASDYVLQSVKAWPPFVTREAARLARAIDIVLTIPNAGRQATTFADAAFGSVRSKLPLPLRLRSRNDPGELRDLVEHLTQLVMSMAKGPRHARALKGIADLVHRQLLRQLPHDPGRDRESTADLALIEAFYVLLGALKAAGTEPAAISQIVERLSAMRHGMQRL